MIFPLCAVILRDGHAVCAYIPGDGPLLLDVGNCKRQIGHAMVEGRSQILANGILPVNGFVVWREVDCVLGVDGDYSLQLAGIPVPSPLIADTADRRSHISFHVSSSGVTHFASSISGALFHSRWHDMSPLNSLTEPVCSLWWTAFVFSWEDW